MASDQKDSLVGFRITSLGTLISRVLGMVRDMATAALLGMSVGGVMDAFVVAFRVPDLFRRLFGEGALTASYLPAVSEKLESDRDSAWQFASAMLAAVAVLVGGLVLLGELLCFGLWLALDASGSVPLVVGLTAAMLPYAMLVCLAAYLSATLHALSHFSIPAFVTAVFNVCWLVAAWFVAPHFGPNTASQAYVLAAAVVVGGCVQIAFQWPMLRRFGFRFRFAWQSNRREVGAVLVAMMPTMFGLAVTQINTFVDSMMAWTLTRDPNGPATIAWLGDAEYPVRQGAAAAIYYSERLYYFPLGLVGLAVATVIFPLLSRHAARGDHENLGNDLVIGMRLVAFLAIPAAVGLIMLGEPIARLLFERGEFTSGDTTRTAQMIACYAIGVPAFCALPVLLRGYYAVRDFATPVRVGIFVVGLNLVLNAALVWPLAEQGLALATALAATLHAVVLLWLFARRQSAFGARPLLMTILRAVPASAAMAIAIWSALDSLPDGKDVGQQMTRVGVTMAAAVVTYFLVNHVLGGHDDRKLLGRR